MTDPADDALREKCGTCKFYFESPANESLQRSTVCRRFPPQGQVIPTQAGATQIGFFPAVQSHHWCGEYSFNKMVLQ